MLFGERLLSTRKKKKISQDELAKKIGAHAPIIGRYEREEVKPSVEIATKIAEALEVSLDYLTGLSDVELDKNVTNVITSLQKLKPEDQQHILTTLNALIRDAKARSAYTS
ncbi:MULTISPECIES: helix-turn-helix domain-containing protein [unclassified Aquimarina]|uniref:helix-turn-helix domain-containing protein n=1 Tax=unclassified Aquimarina TaxID=2627091 RepID=UPI0018C8FFAA|nr:MULTISPECIES: helix-turn-helix transcriptional regulator [unclassified Aquimarina]MBG6130722.1 transcriptional regulator with XRE-family HTH domain [Aquimarina sp. EL_35]MBG6151132.1 transcriptional regulator with XRE-family HTH domain [Aquimarina sp. EL_32]